MEICYCELMAIESATLRRLTNQADLDGVKKHIVGMLVERGGEVLLLHRPPEEFMGGIWELPSGNVEAGEELDDAIRRELKEETGLDLAAIGGFIGSFDYLSTTGKKSRQFNFTVDVAATEPVQLLEHDRYQWAPLAGDLPVTAALRSVLVRYQECRGEGPARATQGRARRPAGHATATAARR